MKGIVDYMHDIIIVIVGLIPPAVALLIFDHSFFIKSDIYKSVNSQIFWGVLIVMYSACFSYLYRMTVSVYHSTKTVNIGVDNWKSVMQRMIFWSIIAGTITIFRHGNFIHFIGNSFILAVSVNVILLIMYGFALNKNRSTP
jgi:hypothetical protein